MADKYVNLTLSITQGGETKDQTFTQESVTVGAGPTADLKVSGEGVSDIHAMFDASRGTEVFIMDLGSSSGTFVNDKKVNKQKLQEGDAIKVGDVQIGVKAILEPGAEAPVAEEAAEEAVEEAHEDAAETEVKDEEATEEAAAEAKPEEAEEAAAEAPAEEEAVEAKEEAKEEAVEAKAEEAEEKAEAIDEDEKKAFEEKKAAFEARKKEAATRGRYDLAAIPDKRETPKTKTPALEAREVVWGTTLLSVKQYDKPVTLTFGESKKSDFFLSSDYLPSANFNVSEGKGGKFAMNFTDAMSGTMEVNGDSFAFKDAAKKKRAESKGSHFQTVLEPNMAMHYIFDDVTYYFHLVDVEKVETIPLTKRIDYPITILMVVLLLVYTLGTIHLKSLPAPEVADILDAPDRFAKLILEPIEMEEPPPPEEEKIAIESEEKAIGDEGKVGEEEAVVDKTEGSQKKRLEDQKVADSSGILGALDQGMENQDRLFGGGGLGAGLEKNLGMLEGISGLDMRGAGGLGTRGAGLGGGGTALGIGGLGTKGRGGGKRGAQYGIGAAGNLKKKGANINIGIGNPNIVGALDKSIIARIIKKHYSQIRYCYQKELTKNPKLYGKISIKFTISGRGTVSSSVVQVSTMKNFQVEQCVAKTIKRIIFPQPKGGGIVVVTYPFIFKAEGT